MIFLGLRIFPGLRFFFLSQERIRDFLGLRKFLGLRIFPSLRIFAAFDYIKN